MQRYIDQWTELEHDLGVLESWIPTAIDRISSAANVSSSSSADQLSAQMNLLLVSFPLHVFLHFPVIAQKQVSQCDREFELKCLVILCIFVACEQCSDDVETNN